MKLYSSKLAPSPLKVLIFLAEKKIKDVEIINLNLGELEHKKPEYMAIAPNSRVPALKLDDGSIILETTAICRYLESIYPEPNMFGENPMEIALIEMWYSRVTYELATPLAHGFRHTHPHMSEMEDQNQEFGLSQRNIGIKALNNFNEIIASKEFIAGDKFSYADIQMAVNLNFLVRLNRLDLKGYKNLNDYVIKVFARPSFSI
ncbi:MAG: glutathione S-transferase [Gammaproteobacteria bacterium]|nr:glutathione S-transferase [Gammaproteobacteria bacterium]